MEYRREVQGNDLVPLFNRELVDRGHVLHSGIVDEDIHLARTSEQCFNPSGAHQVSRNMAGVQFLAQCCDLFVRPEARKDHFRPFGMHRPGNRQANARGGTRNQRALAL